MVPFGDMLARRLAEQGMSQAEFARRAQVPRSVISEVIHGRRKPPRVRAKRWADILGIAPGDRLAWERHLALARADACLTRWIDELHAAASQRTPDAKR